MRSAKHVKKMHPAKLTAILFFIFVGGLVLWALIYSIVNPVPHNSGSQRMGPVPASGTSASAQAHPEPSPGATHATVPSAPRTGASKPAPSPTVQEYTVRAGDSLSSIAAKFHLHGYASLYHANQAAIGSDPNAIWTGMHLTIPATGARA